MRALPDDTAWIRDYLQVIGERIRAARLHQNLTQEKVYLAAGIDRRTLQEVEAGRGNPRVETLLRIAAVLDIPIGQLMQHDAPRP
ncbi:helix-turn-helix domain-containing protein [Streptomyces sp. UH6]|uniref:helix-turn-helix domain-containing protein n=1 Tax=Streptomyces sp. UH6 TaxID=2748379 RepID=UPI0015D48164|nr:helix-turn-helix transcriptional regulator [Streptomyces sp. UH6]NYV73002.1 helix-turn-helix transcriptional regulator [Streptomyces sp. UH6]